MSETTGTGNAGRKERDPQTANRSGLFSSDIMVQRRLYVVIVCYGTSRPGIPEPCSHLQATLDVLKAAAGGF